MLLPQPVGSIKEIIDYMKKFYYNKLFVTEGVNLGREKVVPVRVLALTTTRVD